MCGRTHTSWCSRASDLVLRTEPWQCLEDIAVLGIELGSAALTASKHFYPSAIWLVKWAERNHGSYAITLQEWYAEKWQPVVQRDRVLFLLDKNIVMLIFMGSSFFHREEIIGHFPSLEATLIQNSCPSEKVSTPAWCMLFTYDFILIVLRSRDWPLLLPALSNDHFLTWKISNLLCLGLPLFLRD